MPKGKGYGKARSKFVPKKNAHKSLPKHVQKSSKKSQKRFIKYTTGSEKTRSKMLAKSKEKGR